MSTVNSGVRMPIGLALFLAAATAFIYSRFRKRHAAPGPPRVPILGNVLQHPRKLQFLQYTEWAKKYGPIFSLDLLGQHIVVVNTYEAASDLFDRQSNIYNDRPRMIMANEILGDGIFLPLVKYGDVWRRLRRATHDSFNARAVQQFRPIHRQTASLALLKIINDPESWGQTMEWFAASSIFSSVYGWPPLESESPVIVKIREFMARFTDAAMPGNFLVDLFPIMNYLPSWMAPWKREALEWNQSQSNLFEESEADILKRMNTDEARGFAVNLISAGDKFGLTKKELTWLPGIMATGAIETTSAALENCVLAMLHDPQIMHKAQAELDSVIGRERSPTFEDRDNLPYIRAMIRELVRWRPIAPLALPHFATEDNWYDGYFIPKGTILIGNIWAMNRDPSIHTDPDVYRPERYLDASGKMDVTPPNSHHLGHISYGFGRRICAGMNFAEQALFITVATLLWAFDLQPPVDEQGKMILPPQDKWHDNGAVVRPAPFACRFALRFPEVKSILESDVLNRTTW